MQIHGKVIHGDGYGRKIGFPTVNLDRDEYINKSRQITYGIYAGFALREKTSETYKSAIVIGPEDAPGVPKIEAHFLDFAGNLYGEDITLELKKLIRPFQEFKSEALLIEQIKKDIEEIKKCLQE